MTGETLVRVLSRETGFLEGLRWRSGLLWASSVNDRLIVARGADGGWIEYASLADDYPAGLGWTPDGDLLVVAMLTLEVRRYRAGKCVQSISLARLARFACNDLLVTPEGDAFVSQFGYDFRSSPRRPEAAALIHIDRHGGVRRTGSELRFPNGMALSADGRTLVVAETDARCLTAFDHDGHGGLSNPRVMADLAPAQPDDIAMDAHGGVWACCLEHGMIHVDARGKVTRRIELEAPVYSCALGGPDGRDLFCSTFVRDPTQPPASVRTGTLVGIRVAVPATEPTTRRIGA